MAAGVDRQLAELLHEHEQHRRREEGANPTALLAIRDELSARMFSLGTQLLAMEFEVDCVRGLLLETLSDYEEGETDRQLALTIASLVTGAATGIAAGVWDLANTTTDAPAVENGPVVVALVGAGATTALGIPVLVRRRRPILYMHVAEWNRILEDAVPEGDRERARAIIFGEGGVYDPALLDVHQAMLQELGGTLDSLARDIDMLGTALTIVLEEEVAEVPAAPSVVGP